jgi:ribosome recycling factor
MATLQEVKTNAEQKMLRSIENLKANLAKIRTGRAHTGLLDHIHVDYYGSPTALSQVANVNLVDSRTIGVQPYEKKMVAVIEKAIQILGLILRLRAISFEFRCLLLPRSAAES